jgi:hypothetical protein
MAQWNPKGIARVPAHSHLQDVEHRVAGSHQVEYIPRGCHAHNESQKGVALQGERAGKRGGECPR